MKPLATNKIDFDKVVAQLLTPPKDSVKAEARAVENTLKNIIQLWSSLMCFKGGKCKMNPNKIVASLLKSREI